MLIFVERGGGADSLAPVKSLDWGTDALVVSANRNKVIRVTVYLASNENSILRFFGVVKIASPKPMDF